ncbi:uncharacterized protein QC763_0074340 [Podospora pseudopauciseta]|uniref:Uncharacterized protein n=2 Tax=Podospora TaxID=5144 RepID=A0ABR0H9T9_9PEZI|nr:hypothetical protein QC763_0074340 [Podospora pseudopauciseta]KAK4675940.1 hypothetical protein QC764_0083290 [Podospora pseudoanserina]
MVTCNIRYQVRLLRGRIYQSNRSQITRMMKQEDFLIIPPKTTNIGLGSCDCGTNVHPISLETLRGLYQTYHGLAAIYYHHLWNAQFPFIGAEVKNLKAGYKSPFADFDKRLICLLSHEFGCHCKASAYQGAILLNKHNAHPRHESQAPGLGSEVHQADLHCSHNVEAAWRRENQSQPL